MSGILESTNRAAVDRWIAPWLNADDREFDRLTSDYRRMMADADANQLARGRHQFTDASGLIEENRNGNA